MPIRPYWLGRLPEIIAGVSVVSMPTLDRRAVERIFGLRRRRAIELMHQLGSYRSGIQCFDNTRKTIWNSASPLLGRQGENLGAVEVLQDITEQRGIQAALATS